MYFEVVDDMLMAIQREKIIKRYVRKWKVNLIERENLEWRDLYEDII